jgi:hypothetical protein
MRDLPEHSEIVQRLGFVKNTPFNFEDMVKKLVYKKEVQGVRDKMTDEKALDENDPEVLDKEKVNVDCLLEIYQRSSDVHQASVNKYEMIYQLNKRNIITTVKLEDTNGSAKEQFYKEYFQKIVEEREISQISGFPYHKGSVR